MPHPLTAQSPSDPCCKSFLQRALTRSPYKSPPLLHVYPYIQLPAYLPIPAADLATRTASPAHSSLHSPRPTKLSHSLRRRLNHRPVLTPPQRIQRKLFVGATTAIINQLGHSHSIPPSTTYNLLPIKWENSLKLILTQSSTDC